jgi:hypothetical protein
VLRTGRFDYSVLVDYPTEEELEFALQGMLNDRPHDSLNLSEKPVARRSPDERRRLGRERSGPADGAGAAGPDHGGVPAGRVEPLANLSRFDRRKVSQLWPEHHNFSYHGKKKRQSTIIEGW